MPLGLYEKNHHHAQGCLIGSYVISRSSEVLCFTFRSMVHFGFMFVEGMKSVSRIICLHVDVHLFKHHSLKRLFCLLYYFCSFAKINWIYLCGSISGFSVLFLIYVSILSPVLPCLEECSFLVSSLEIKCQSSKFVFLLQHWFGCSQSFAM